MTVAPAPTARARAAAALRELGHALVGHETTDAMLLDVATWAEQQTAVLHASATRERPDDALVREVASAPVADDGEPIVHFADCPVSGTDNPFAIPAAAHREGDEAVVIATLGRAHEGAPGRAHGGVVAALFDDAFGFLSGLGNTTMYAGRLEVTYLEPTPLGLPLEVRCRLGELVGRRQHASGTLRHGAHIVATASTVLVTVSANTVGRATYDGVTRTSCRR